MGSTRGRPWTEEPRDDNGRHDLLELLLIALCAVLCGAEDRSDMALLGARRRRSSASS